MRRVAFDARNIRRRSRPGSPFRSGAGHSRRGWSGAGGPRRSRSGPHRLVLEVLMWLVGRDSEQGVMLHVCSKAFQHRLFGMTSSEVGARRAWRAVGGAWRDSATMCYSGPGAGRSGGRRGAPGAGGAPGPRSGVIPPLPRAGVREHHAPVGALRQKAVVCATVRESGSTTHL